MIKLLLSVMTVFPLHFRGNLFFLVPLLSFETRLSSVITLIKILHPLGEGEARKSQSEGKILLKLVKHKTHFADALLILR